MGVGVSSRRRLSRHALRSSQRWLKISALALSLLFFPLMVVRGGGLPAFASDAAADQWLRANSPYYRMMAFQVDALAGYEIRGSDEIPAGMAGWESDKVIIELSNTLSGDKRVSILIFELTNAYQDAQHSAIDLRTNEGKIKTAREFGILHELIELDGLRHHRAVLEELDKKVHGISAEMLQWINPDLKTLGDYEVPYAFDFINAQEEGGHTAHYYEWFYRQAPATPTPEAK